MKLLIISDLYEIKKDNSIPKIVQNFAVGLSENNLIKIIRPNFLLNSILRNHKIIKNGIYFKNNIEIFNRNFFFPFLFENKNFINKLKEENFDCIISHMPSGHIYSSLINKNLKLPHIAIIHQSDYKILNDIKYSFHFKNKLKSSLKKATLIGARNNFLKEKFNADFLLPSFIEEKNIVSKKEFNLKNKLKIITLSKLIKRKNLNLVIQALKKVDFDFEYSIYGFGKEKNKLEQLIKKLKLENKIKIYNHINHDLINQKLDENDIFILPSINETFGVSYLEALSRGLITIGIKNTGIDGIIENNKNGFLIEPKTNDIIEILNQIKNKTNVDLISDNAIKTARNLTKEKVIINYVNKIRSIV